MSEEPTEGEPIEDITAKQPSPADVDTFMAALDHRLRHGSGKTPPNKAKAVSWTITYFRVWSQSHRFADLNNAITVNPALIPADLARYLLRQAIPHADKLPAFPAFAAGVNNLPPEPTTAPQE